MERYQLITKFGVTDGHYDYHQIAENQDMEPLIVMAGITQFIPYAKDDELFLTERYFSSKLNCYVGMIL